MRILFTSTYGLPYLSGITKYIFRIAKHYSLKNQVTWVCFKHKPDLKDSEFSDKLQMIRVHPHLKISKGFLNFFLPLISLRLVLKNDIVFVNLPQIESICFAFWAKLLGKKLVAIYYCDLVFENNWLLKLIAFLSNSISFFTCFLAQKIVVYSPDYAKTSPVLKWFLKKTQYCLPPIISFKPSPNYRHILYTTYNIHNSPIIGFVGRVSSEKGLNYLVAALVKLKNKYPRLALLIAGPKGKEVAGENSYYNKFQQLVQQSRLPVYFLGRISDEELFAFYKSINLLVLPSTNRTEAFGMVQIEAMLMDKPVVASNLVGVNLPVQLTKAGLLFEAKNSADLAKQIDKVLSNEQKYLPQEKEIRDLFNLNKVFNFYDQLL